jgi:hypothetical protein
LYGLLTFSLNDSKKPSLFRASLLRSILGTRISRGWEDEVNVAQSRFKATNFWTMPVPWVRRLTFGFSLMLLVIV